MATEPRFFNGSRVASSGEQFVIIGRSIDGKSVTYDLEDAAGDRTYEVAESDLEAVTPDDVSLGQKRPAAGPADAAALTEGATVTQE